MKFIHTGDIHWGMCPDADKPWGKERAQAIKDTFRKIVEKAKELDVDCMFISGDLFHRQPLMKDLKEVNYLFSTIPGVKVILIAGNHDKIRGNSALLSFTWSPNVTWLMDETLTSVYFEDINTEVYGFSYHTTEIKEARLEDIQVPLNSRIQILMAHGGDAAHLPINFNSLELSPFSYIALGHIHKPQVLLKNRIAFSGALEPIDRNDTGPHGFMKVICTQEGTTAEFVPFASCSYLDLDFDVKEETTQFELEEWVHKAIRVAGEDNIYRVRLRGLRDVKTEFSARRLEQTGNVSEVVDETRPAYDFTELSQIYEGGLIGEYVDCFAGSEDPVEQKALFYGIEALLDAKREL